MGKHDTWINESITHQPDQAPTFTPDATDGGQLDSGKRVTVMSIAAFWDTYEVWRNRMRWLASTRQSLTNRKRLKGDEE